VDARERKEGEGKKRDRKNVEMMGIGEGETASTRKYKKLDRAKNFSLSHIFHEDAILFHQIDSASFANCLNNRSSFMILNNSSFSTYIIFTT
jgi:hypothetical protein